MRATRRFVTLGIACASLAASALLPAAAQAAEELPEVALNAPTPQPRSVVVNGTVNPRGTTITKCVLTVEEYLAFIFTELYLQTHECTVGTGNIPVPVSGEFTGLLPNSEYIERLSASNASGTAEAGEVRIFTASEAPKVNEVSVGAITRTSAVVQAFVVPEKSNTNYHVLWGTTSDYAAATPSVSAGGALEGNIVVVKLEGLEPGTTYHYQVVAENPGGEAASTDQEFTTASRQGPSVTGATVTGLEPGAALVSARVFANGLPSSYEINFGTNTEYETRLSGEVIGEEQTVGMNLLYLIPETTYHYKFVVKNADGVAESPDQTFFTPRYPLKLPQILPQVSALIAAFPSEESTYYEEPAKKTGKKGHKATGHHKKTKQHKKKAKKAKKKHR